MELNPPNWEANRTVKAAVNGCDQGRCHKGAAAGPYWSFSRHRRTVVGHVWECNPQEFPTALELTTEATSPGVPRGPQQSDLLDDSSFHFP